MDSVLFWNEVLLIGGAVVGFVCGMNCGYERGRQGLSFWGKSPPLPVAFAEQIIDGRLYSTLAAKQVCCNGERFLYLTPGGQFFTVSAGAKRKIDLCSRSQARGWVLANLTAREGRAVLEEWFAERTELA